MPTQPAEPKTTPAASTSATSPQPNPSPVGVTAPPLTVRPQTPSATTAPQPDPSPGSGTDAGELHDPINTDTPSASEDVGGPTAPLKLKKRPLTDVVRGLVLGATVAIHQALARSEIEQAHGVWLMGEDEAAGVADPLANIAGRRMGGAVVNADAGDLIAAGVAAAGYLITNAIKAFQLKRAVRSMQRAGVITETEPEPAPEGAAA